jgi:hypothetical protein
LTIPYLRGTRTAYLLRAHNIDGEGRGCHASHSLGTGRSGAPWRIDGVRALSLGQRRSLANLADEVTAVAGETIMHQGEPGRESMMLEEGTADVG